MKYKRLNLRDLPKGIDLSITSELVPFSVCLSRISGEDPSTFQPLGSGTLVRKSGKFGILTAHHCLHGFRKEVELGRPNGDTLLCMLKDGDMVRVESHEAFEVPLGFPADAQYSRTGPDLTFIEIPEGPKLASFKAFGSFWNLDLDVNEMAAEFGKVGNLLVNAGFPEADYKTELTVDAIHHDVRFMSFISAIDDGDVSQNLNWDYIRSRCNYNEFNELPRSFSGVSGGGVWSVRLLYREKSEVWEVRDFALIGVTFYQTEVTEGIRELVGHYIASIYQRAWN
jgi:hypothetical protein